MKKELTVTLTDEDYKRMLIAMMEIYNTIKQVTKEEEKKEHG